MQALAGCGRPAVQLYPAPQASCSYSPAEPARRGRAARQRSQCRAMPAVEEVVRARLLVQLRAVEQPHALT